MKRVIIFLIFWLATTGICFATDYNAVILPSSYLKKTDNCILYSKNLEEILSNDLIKNFVGQKKFTAPTTSSLKHTLSSNPQLNSGIGTKEKTRILAKIYSANKVINISVKYEIKSMNSNQNNSLHEKMALITDNTTIRILTTVKLLDISDDKLIWSNVYCKTINFESVNNKDTTIITNYYEKLSQKIAEELKTQANTRPIGFKQQEKPKVKTVTEPTVEIHHEVPKAEQPKNTNIKPQLQLQEDVTNQKTEKKQSKNVFSNIKNIQLKLNLPFTPKEAEQKEIKTEEVKLQQVQPTYTNIHVTPRKNSRDYTPKFNNSVNDI